MFYSGPPASSSEVLNSSVPVLSIGEVSNNVEGRGDKVFSGRGNSKMFGYNIRICDV
jgi:hypothetical protein